MENAKICHITRLRIDEDGEGVRSVIFTHGCPLSCLWCCNPDFCKGTDFKTLTPQALFNHIARDLPYFEGSNGGVTFSGGEPLLHTAFIKAFLERYGVKFNAAIETSLYLDPLPLAALIREWFVDFKVFDDLKHRTFTGVSNEPIKRHLRALAAAIDPAQITVALPLIPDYNTDFENLEQTAAFLRSLGIGRLALHPYRKSQEQAHRLLGLKPTVIRELPAADYREIERFFAEQGFTFYGKNPTRERDKCHYLKAIRKQLCAKEQIPVMIPDCPYQGPCKGTCPQCESELDAINQWRKNHALSSRRM